MTKDIVLRLKAQIMGIQAEDFEREQISDDDAQYTGRTEVYIPEDKVKEFKKKGISLEEVYQSDEEGNHTIPEFHENEFVILKPDQSTKKTLLGRVSSGKIVQLVYKKSKPYGISPRNVGQYFYAGSPYDRCKRSSPCYHQRNGGNRENIFIRLLLEWKRYITIRHRNIAV